jgi:anti-anti-sigma regulatory factor
MRTKIRSVAIRKLPERISGQRDDVFKDLETCINVDRPAVVLDCSMLGVLDGPAIHLLLCCLEEAMKRNGDVRLAALRPEAQRALQAAEVDSLFQTFDQISEAVDSFYRPQIDFAAFERPSQDSRESQMNAA